MGTSPAAAAAGGLLFGCRRESASRSHELFCGCKGERTAATCNTEDTRRHGPTACSKHCNASYACSTVTCAPWLACATLTSDLCRQPAPQQHSAPHLPPALLPGLPGYLGRRMRPPAAAAHWRCCCQLLRVLAGTAAAGPVLLPQSVWAARPSKQSRRHTTICTREGTQMVP